MKLEIYIIVFFVLFSSFTFEKTIDSPVLNWKIEILPIKRHHKGDTICLRVTADIPKGYYTYGNDSKSEEGPLPSELVFDKKSKNLFLGRDTVIGKESEKVYEEIFKATFTKIKGQISITRYIVLKQKKLEFNTSLQLCNDDICIFKEDKFKIKAY